MLQSESLLTGVLLPTYREWRVAGMDPKAIANLVAREKYKGAILKNQLNNLMNERQGQLHHMETQFAKPIVEYMNRVAASDGAASCIRPSLTPALRRSRTPK